MNSLTLSITILSVAIACSFFCGLFTRNYSTVDRLWSIIPGIYVFVWLPESMFNQRYLIAGALVILWCVRLTTNFAIKGGYSFSFKKGFIVEDYRWEYLRQKIKPRLLFELFNLLFISAFQSILIFMFTLPLYYYGKITGPLRPEEVILYGLFLFFLTMETIADIQQLTYYRHRNKEPWRNNPRYKIGFNTFGLWKFSRHPNYVCEFFQWIIVSLYLHVSLGYFHWSGIGAVALVFLFIGSTNFAEQITQSKYPAYKKWKTATPPWFLTVDFFARARARKEFFRELEKEVKNG